MNPPKPISEKKAAANRRNAQKSTGPRTSEGKNQSKLNAFQHGMRAAATVLPNEDAAAFEARKLAWKEELQPASDFETYLVDLVVDNSWRLDRCRRAEASRLARQVRDARDDFDRAIAERNRVLIEELPNVPARVAAQLRETSGGTAWLIDRFEWLLGALDCRGYWEPSEKDHALNLLGKSADQIFSDPMVLDISEAFLNSGWIEETNPSEIASLLNLDLYPPKGMKAPELRRRIEGFVAARARAAEALEEHQPEFDPVERAQRDLNQLLNRELQLLRGRLASLQAKEAADRAEAAIGAACDTSMEGQAVARYEASQRRAFHSALRDLMKHRGAKAEDSEPPTIEECPTAPEQPPLALVAPNEPTAVLPEVAQAVAVKEVAKPRFKGYRKPEPPPTSALSQVRGYGGAVPLDPARWLADQEYYHGEMRNDASCDRHVVT